MCWIVRAIIVFSAALFTFVLLIALVKHHLHMKAKDWNIKKLEDRITENTEWETYRFEFAEPDEVEKALEYDPGFLIRSIGKLRAHLGLEFVMIITFLVDVFLGVGICEGWW